jgi:hypothetical protein
LKGLKGFERFGKFWKGLERFGMVLKGSERFEKVWKGFEKFGKVSNVWTASLGTERLVNQEGSEGDKWDRVSDTMETRDAHASNKLWGMLLGIPYNQIIVRNHENLYR